MKSLRSTFSGIAVFGAMLLLSGVLFAEQGSTVRKEHHQAKIKLLLDSAIALQQSHPELTKGLSDYANEEVKESQDHKEGMGAHKESEGAAEKQVEGRRQAHIKLLRDSAAALQVSRPDLAADLTKAADHQVKHIKGEGQEDSKEVGEKNE